MRFLECTMLQMVPCGCTDKRFNDSTLWMNEAGSYEKTRNTLAEKLIGHLVHVVRCSAPSRGYAARGATTRGRTRRRDGRNASKLVSLFVHQGASYPKGLPMRKCSSEGAGTAARRLSMPSRWMRARKLLQKSARRRVQRSLPRCT